MSQSFTVRGTGYMLAAFFLLLVNVTTTVFLGPRDSIFSNFLIISQLKGGRLSRGDV